MVKIHPQIIEKDGKKEFVVLPYEEFIRVQGELEDYEDLRLLRQAKDQEEGTPAHSFEEAKKLLGAEQQRDDQRVGLFCSLKQRASR